MSDPFVIRVLDLETSGMEPPEVPIEAGWCDVFVDPDLGVAVQGTGEATYVDPEGRPLSPEACAVHHIIPSDLFGAPKWPVAVARLKTPGVLPIRAFAAHHKKFEAQWLPPDVLGAPLICTLKAAKRLLPDAPSHSNQALRYWLGLQVRRSIADQSHRAGPDSYVTAHLLVELMKRASLEQLIEWSDQPLLLTGKLGFSQKHADKDWSEVPTDFLRWMLEPGKNFDEDTLFTAKWWLDEHARRPQRAALQQMGPAA